jgi:pimeloyl-ACP methyl ester carboxylesterase
MMRGIAKTKGMSAIIDMMRTSPLAVGPLRRTPLPDAVQRFMDGMREMSVDGFLGGAQAMQGWAGTATRLHQIAVPTLVLVGENDNLLNASRVIHRKIAESRFVLLRNCMHGSNLWRPDAFLSAVLGFLADVDAGRPVASEITVD